MNQTERSIFWLCVILTMAMAFTAMMISLPRTVNTVNPVNLDYQGVIVSAFAVLVTILLGWQIFSALELSRAVRRNEGRVNVARVHINAERERIGRIATISQEYNDGNYFSILALVQYYEIIRRGNNLNVEDAARQLRNCYMISARAMTHYLGVFDENMDSEEMIRQALDSCVQIFRLSSERLFGQRYLNVIAMTFSLDDHNTCNEYYAVIMRHFDLFEQAHIATINQYRRERIALINESE